MAMGGNPGRPVLVTLIDAAPFRARTLAGNRSDHTPMFDDAKRQTEGAGTEAGATAEQSTAGEPGPAEKSAATEAAPGGQRNHEK